MVQIVLIRQSQFYLTVEVHPVNMSVKPEFKFNVRHCL